MLKKFYIKKEFFVQSRDDNIKDHYDLEEVALNWVRSLAEDLSELSTEVEWSIILTLSGQLSG